jgi:hypothetical protein
MEELSAPATTSNETIHERLRQLIDHWLHQGRLSSDDLQPRLYDRFGSISHDLPTIESLAMEFERADLTNIGDRTDFLCDMIERWTLKSSSKEQRTSKPGPDEAKLKVDS